MSSFGILLARNRREKRMSQADLAAASGVSQRHLSFLETGRSAPGRKALVQVIEALMLAKPEADQLLAAAGLGPHRPALDWHAPSLASVRETIALMLGKHDPFPALACNRAGDILVTNSGFDRALGAAGIDRSDWSNLYDLTLSPEGLAARMVNPEAIVPHTIHRLRMAAATSEAAENTLRRASQFAVVRDYRLASGGAKFGGVLVERYRLEDRDIALISVTAGFGSPEEEIAQQIQIELFFPADEATRAFLEA
jgi:transcriptional regulator with XRE-family HTH domain